MKSSSFAISSRDMNVLVKEIVFIGLGFVTEKTELLMHERSLAMFELLYLPSHNGGEVLFVLDNISCTHCLG